MSDRSFHARLRTLVGQRFRYTGEIWVLHEVLGEEDAVMLLREQHVTTAHLRRGVTGSESRGQVLQRCMLQ